MGYLLCLRSSRQRWCRIGLAAVALTGTLAAACNSRQPAPVVPPTREVAVVTIATEPVTTQQVAEATLRAFEAQAESDKTAIAAAEAAVEQARAAVRLTENEQEIALTTHEKAIQTAFRETADTAAALGTIEDRIRAHTALIEAASEAYRLSQVRYQNRIDSYLEVLDAQRSLYSAQQAMVWLQLARISSQIRFYEVLGGQGFRP